MITRFGRLIRLLCRRLLCRRLLVLVVVFFDVLSNLINSASQSAKLLDIWMNALDNIIHVVQNLVRAGNKLPNVPRDAENARYQTTFALATRALNTIDVGLIREIIEEIFDFALGGFDLVPILCLGFVVV